MPMRWGGESNLHSTDLCRSYFCSHKHLTEGTRERETIGLMDVNHVMLVEKLRGQMQRRSRRSAETNI
jgi:hypothetical protein